MLTNLLPFVIVGLVAGSIYGMTAVGLVLTYRTSGIFNFAYGAIAAANAYIFYQLRQTWGLPSSVAVLICLGIAAPLMGIGFEAIAKRLTGASTVSKVVVTIGLLIAVQGLLIALFGPTTIQFNALFPQSVISLGSVNVGIDQLITLTIGLAITVGLSLFLSRTHVGVAMRGVVDDPVLLDLSGGDPTRVRRIAWMIGCSVTGLSGILLAPVLGLDAITLTQLVLAAFAAAAIGRFSSLWLTYVGGLVIGVGAALCTKFVGSSQVFAGLPSSFPFVVLFVVLLITPRRRLVEFGAPVARAMSHPLLVASKGVRIAGGGALAVVLLLVPTFAGFHLTSFTAAVIYVLMFSSLRLLVVTSGQASLCQAAFAAIGATTFCHLANDGWPWFLALAIAGLVVVPVGAILAIPAIRLSGIYLALITFGYGILLELLIFTTPLMFGDQSSLQVGRPDLEGLQFSGDKSFYYLCLALVAVGVGIVHVLGRTRLGRLLRGMSDSPTGLATLGDDVNRLRVLVFCISAFFAAIAGALLTSLIGTVSPTTYPSFFSLTLVVVLAISGGRELAGPIIAAIIYVLLPSYVNSAALSNYLPVIFGVGAIVAVLFTPGRGAGRCYSALVSSAKALGRRSPVRA